MASVEPGGQYVPALHKNIELGVGHLYPDGHGCDEEDPGGQ
jgi:hypothetical protein